MTCEYHKTTGDPLLFLCSSSWDLVTILFIWESFDFFEITVTVVLFKN